MPNFKLASKEDYEKFIKKSKRVRLDSDTKLSRILDKIPKSQQYEFHYRFFDEEIVIKELPKKVISLYNGKGIKIACVFKSDNEIHDEREIRLIALNHYFISLPDSKMKSKHGYAIN